MDRKNRSMFIGGIGRDMYLLVRKISRWEKRFVLVNVFVYV